MKDFLRIYVLWDDGSTEGRRLADRVSEQFDGIGMERDGVAIRIPVRFRSEPWDGPGGPPRPINLEESAHNAFILLHDGEMHDERAIWNPYVETLRQGMEARGKVDAYIAFGSPDRDPALAADDRRHTQYARRDKWEGLTNAAARDARFLMHVLYRLRELMRRVLGVSDSEPLFVSHAKADGDTTARAIVDYVNDLSTDVPLKTFYDAKELAAGQDFEERFHQEILRGTLLAIVSDIYDSRPWCIFELTTAKRARRPIVLADVGRVRTSRTFPYGANLPKIRVSPSAGDSAWIEALLVETLAEGLRCDVFQAQATHRLHETGLGPAVVLPRPPELFDIVDSDPCGLIVYPDPPLSALEERLLRKATARTGSSVPILTLSEIA